AAGAEPVVADVLDRNGLLDALRGLRADAVLHELTALASAPMGYRSMHATNVLRTTGTAHLLDAARQLGARRFVTQSIVFGYGYGRSEGTVDETAPFGVPDGTGVDATLLALAENERAVREADGIERIALRYGLVYGLDADSVRRMRRRRMLPVTDSTGSVPITRRRLQHRGRRPRADLAQPRRGRCGRARRTSAR